MIDNTSSFWRRLALERKKPMVRVVTATEAKNRFGTFIKEVYLGEGHVIVTRGDIPVVAIVPMGDYEQLISPEDLPAEVGQTVAASTREARARQRLLAFLDRVQGELPEVSEEEAQDEIEQAIRAIRKTK
jgi:prevent-host-death family protein